MKNDLLLFIAVVCLLAAVTVQDCRYEKLETKYHKLQNERIVRQP